MSIYSKFIHTRVVNMAKRYAIFAVGRGGEFGVKSKEHGSFDTKGDLPWRFPQELKWFAKVTIGNGKEENAVIMGRKTWESLPPQHRPLKGRRNIVVSRRNMEDENTGCKWVKSLDEAYGVCKDQTTFVIGGKSLLEEFFERPDSHGYFKTQIDGTFPDADVFLDIPKDTGDFKLIEKGDCINTKDGKFYSVMMKFHLKFR